PPRTLAYLTLSTGIGGGVVERGEMFVGSYGLAPEIGHMTIDRSDAAPRCQCGSSGCLEALASGTAIARIARARLSGAARPDSILAAYEMESISSEMVFEAAAQGDEMALDILEDVVRALSIGLTNVLHLFNPDLVVLGGGVTAGLDELGLLPAIRGAMLQRAMSARHKDFCLVASRLGDAAGMAGAATLVWKELDAARLPGGT
ncbi:MAG: ROK family protein, partial [Chloroflexota bacterium]